MEKIIYTTTINNKMQLNKFSMKKRGKTSYKLYIFLIIPVPLYLQLMKDHLLHLSKEKKSNQLKLYQQYN